MLRSAIGQEHVQYMSEHWLPENLFLRMIAQSISTARLEGWNLKV
jgi:hypothetical protein